MKTPKEIKKLRGAEKAAILFLCLGEKRGADLMQRLDEKDIHEITRSISGLGTIPPQVADGVLIEFMQDLGSGGALIGSLDLAESMLRNFLPEDRVTEIMGEVQGPMVGRNMWENFSALNEQVIANYLKGEHDQTIATIMTKVKPDMAAKVLPLLGQERMIEVVERMISMDVVPRHVLQQIEDTLQHEFMASATRGSGPDPHQRIADLFNKLDSSQFERLTTGLEQRIPEAFNTIKQKMFTFDDLIRLDVSSLARVMRGAEGNALPLALRGAKKDVRDYFLGALPARSRDMLLEEMASMGPVRGRDVQAAQSSLVDYAKELAKDDEIRLPVDDDDLLID